jgi:hypothetical protein
MFGKQKLNKEGDINTKNKKIKAFFKTFSSSIVNTLGR